MKLIVDNVRYHSAPFTDPFKSLMKSSSKTIQTSVEHAQPVGYLELLRNNRGFRTLWLGQVVSQMGDWFDTIAVYTLALQLTGSSRSVALIMVARFLPSVVMGPLSGVIADRFSRRSIMITSDILRALVVLGFLLVRRPDQMWLVYVLTVFQLAFSTFFEPAKTASIPSIVSNRELLPANAIASVTWSAMLTLGAALGGFVTGWFGTNAAFVLDSLTFVASAILISRVRFPKRSERPKSRLTVSKALGGSILWVFSAVLLQRTVEDQFRGRVFAAEMALVTLTMAASNYVVGELMDRFGFSPRVVTAAVGTFFLLPGFMWFATQKWWDRKYQPISLEAGYRPPVAESAEGGGQ